MEAHDPHHHLRRKLNIVTLLWRLGNERFPFLLLQPQVIVRSSIAAPEFTFPSTKLALLVLVENACVDVDNQPALGRRPRKVGIELALLFHLDHAWPNHG